MTHVATNPQHSSAGTRASDHGLSNVRLLIYVLPAFCLAIMLGPAGSILQGIYTRDLGLKLSDIAGLILIARLFDAFTDPLIGYATDATRGRRWGRKPWLVLGALVSLIGIYWLYFPPTGVTPRYFFLAFVASFLGWTLVEIPHLAWGTDITQKYDDRSRIFTFRFGAIFAGLLVFIAIPVLTMLYKHFVARVPLQNISLEYSRETLHVAFWVVAATLPVAVMLVLLLVPIGTTGTTRPQPHDVRKLVTALLQNKPFRLFCLVMTMFYLATGMQMGIAYLHLSSYLQLANWASIIYLTCIPFNVLSVPMWLWAARRWGKHRAFAVGGALCATLFVAIGCLSPGPYALVGYFVVFGLVQWCQGCWYALPPAILSDVCDYGSLKSGKDNAGAYFAAFVFLNKCTQGVGTGIGFAITGALGFDPTANSQSGAAVWSLRIVMGFFPAALVYVAAWIALYFPITRIRHDVIRKRLARNARVAVLGEAR
jgi:glycoside/pentoside/hexuronide:cation symporter, GPH family